MNTITKLTKLKKQSLVKYLNALGRGKKPVVDGCGICKNIVLSLWIDGYDVVRDYCSKWRHFSGDRQYPIKEINYHTVGKWRGRRGELRRDLCRFMARQIAKELKGQ